MPRTRPYLVRLQGKTRMVEATSREQAIGHCTKPLVDECRPARPKEVMDFARGDGDMETAGVYPDPDKPLDLPSRQPKAGDVVLELAEEITVAAGDGLIRDGETHRRATDEDIEGDILIVPEGAIQVGKAVWWTAAERAPGDAVAHDGHNVQSEEAGG